MKISPVAVFLFLLVIGCRKGPDPSPPLPEPAKASLVLPKQNEACTDGTIVSLTERAVSFSWAAALHADSYELSVKNLLTGITKSQTTTSTQLLVPLLMDVPYSWYVISKSGQVKATAQSDVWKFYNAGLATVSYAPYPAEIMAPTFGQVITNASSIDLSWKGSSVENNITGYDIYLGTSAAVTLLKSNVTDSFVKSVPVSPNTKYYWKVITKDSNGNSSDSGLFQFN